MDSLTPEQRSKLMSHIRSTDTTVEMRVRRLVHGMGYRYRLHRKDLPGKPDMVFASRRSVVFVHGCFWHRHEGCNLGRLPKSRLNFWQPKLEANRERDARNIRELRRLGWRTMVVWQCELEGIKKLGRKIKRFLDDAEKRK